jgi:putative Ca2+/H+ antiporter (TMEM165/GDT1 family)
MLRSLGSEGGGRLVSANPLLSSFLLIALTEWGDKTQIAAVLFAAEYEPLPVLAGAVSALALLSALAIYLGAKLSDRVNPDKTRKLGAAVFIILGFTFLMAAAGDGTAFPVNNDYPAAG